MTADRNIATAVQTFIQSARLKAADGLTWAEFGQLLAELLHMSVDLADVLTLSGPEKKAIVMDAVACLFDTVADKCVPIWLWPIWAVCRSPMRALILALASGITEQFVAALRRKV